MPDCPPPHYFWKKKRVDSGQPTASAEQHQQIETHKKATAYAATHLTCLVRMDAFALSLCLLNQLPDPSYFPAFNPSNSHLGTVSPGDIMTHGRDLLLEEGGLELSVAVVTRNRRFAVRAAHGWMKCWRGSCRRSHELSGTAERDNHVDWNVPDNQSRCGFSPQNLQNRVCLLRS